MSESGESQKNSALKEEAEAVELKSPVGESQLPLALVDDTQSPGLDKELGENALPKNVAVRSVALPVQVFDKRIDESAPPEPSIRLAPGMRRHKLTLAVTALLALGIFGLNLLDLKPLLSQEGTIDRNFVFTPTKQMAELPPNYSYSSGGDPKEGLIPIDEFSFDGQKVGFADSTGHTVIAPKFGVVHDFSQGLAAVKMVGEFGKWGFIDHTGKVVIPATYKAINDFHHGLALVKSDDGDCLIDRNGKVCFVGKGQSLAELPGGFYIVKNDATKLSGLLKGTEWVFPQFYSDIHDLISSSDNFGSFSSNRAGRAIYRNALLAENSDLQYFQLRKNGISSLADSNGKIYFSDRLAFVENVSNGHALAVDKGLYGFTDLTGQWIIAPKYEHATAYDKLIGVMEGSNVHIIDGAGNPIKSVLIDNLVCDAQTYKWFSDGMAIFKRKDLYGYLDASGREAIAPKFKTARPFDHGMARVYDGSRWRYIDKNGKFVSKGEFVEAGAFREGKANVSIPGLLYAPLQEWPKSLSVPDQVKKQDEQKSEPPTFFEVGED